MTHRNIVVEQSRSPNILLRLVYFIVFGLWFSGVWAAIAWFLCVTVIGLPIGLWMLGRLPQVTTLKADTGAYIVTPGGQVRAVEVPQQPFLLRAIYFVLIGWWFSLLWIALAWALSASLIGLPISFWMINRIPAVMTLERA
jgi:uncharacterized membrane protein YccF (DUF307 family)